MEQKKEMSDGKAGAIVISIMFAYLLVAGSIGQVIANGCWDDTPPIDNTGCGLMAFFGGGFWPLTLPIWLGTLVIPAPEKPE